MDYRVSITYAAELTEEFGDRLLTELVAKAPGFAPVLSGAGTVTTVTAAVYVPDGKGTSGVETALQRALEGLDRRIETLRDLGVVAAEVEVLRDEQPAAA